MKITRRQFGACTLSSLALAQYGRAAVPRVSGVRMALQSASFSFSGMDLDAIIKTMQELGLGEIDVMSEHVENYLGAPVQLPGAGRPGPWVRRPVTAAGGSPPAAGRGGGFGRGGDPAVRQAQRQWRLNADLDKFRAIGKKFAGAGLTFFSYNLSFNDSFTDEEIDKGMQMTKALGTRIITASSPASIFPRIAPSRKSTTSSSPFIITPRGRRSLPKRWPYRRTCG